MSPDCERCGAEFTVVGDRVEDLTTVLVFFSDADREDVTASFCGDCADQVLAPLLAVVQGEGDGEEGTGGPA